MPNVVHSLLDKHLEAGDGDRPAFTQDSKSWSYHNLYEATCQVAHGLESHGVSEGERIIILSGDRLEWVALFLGAIRQGSIPVPLNTWFPSGDYEYFFKDSEATTLVLDRDLAAQHLSTWNSFGNIQRLIFLDVDAPSELQLPQGLELECLTFKELIQDQAKTREPVKREWEDPAFWLYSSGTTGRSKGVVHSHESMHFNAENYGVGVLNVQAEDRVYSVAKLFFAYGLGNALYFPLYSGAHSILFPGRCTPQVVDELLQKHQPTVFFAVPTFYAAHSAWLDNHPEEEYPFLRLSVSAGEPLPGEIYQKWKQRVGVDILDGIGSTEMVHIFISNRKDHIRPGSTGLMVPGYEAKILDDQGETCPVGEIGNLWVKGKSSFKEYWKKPDSTSETIVDDWVKTGDKYRVDEEETYWYAGRSDDMLKVSGIWVSPFEVEAALIEHPKVLEAAVIGVENDKGLTQPHAYVILNSDQAGDEQLDQELKSFVKERIAPYKYPRKIYFTDKLPKTATGKIQRYKLRQVKSG